MSKPNKVNRGAYTQAGRLTPDDMARERKKMMRPETGSESQTRGFGNAPERERAPDESRRTSDSAEASDAPAPTPGRTAHEG